MSRGSHGLGRRPCVSRRYTNCPAAVFCHARQRGWYENGPSDTGLLRYVQEMTYALEVSARSRAEWTHAIGTGLACMRAVWSHGGGVLTGGRYGTGGR